MLCHQTLSYNTLKLSVIINYIVPITWLIGIRKKIFSSKFWKNTTRFDFHKAKENFFVMYTMIVLLLPMQLYVK